MSFNLENGALTFDASSKMCSSTGVTALFGGAELQKHVPVVFSLMMKCIAMHRSLEGRTPAPDAPSNHDCQPTSEARSLLAAGFLSLLQY